MQKSLKNRRRKCGGWSGAFSTRRSSCCASRADKGPGSRELVDALFYYRRLWSIFMDDLANPENELPEELRAGLISIGIWMVKEIELIRSGKANDLTAMIEITEIIRDGLK